MVRLCTVRCGSASHGRVASVIWRHPRSMFSIPILYFQGEEVTTYGRSHHSHIRLCPLIQRIPPNPSHVQLSMLMGLNASTQASNKPVWLLGSVTPSYSHGFVKVGVLYKRVGCLAIGSLPVPSNVLSRCESHSGYRCHYSI